MQFAKIWVKGRRPLCFLMVITLPLLAAPAGRAATICDTKHNPEAASNAKYQMEVDGSTVWQERGGAVFFTITGLDPQKSMSVAVCLRSRPEHPKDPDDWAGSVPLEPIRVEQTGGKSGARFAVTLPSDFEDWRFYPVAQLRMIASESPTVPPATTLDVVREIGISAPWFAALLAVVFVVAAAVALYCFARFLQVPGTGVVLRIISSASGWASLAQFQIVLWTLVIGAGAIYVMTLRGSLIDMSVGTLGLLGIAGAAAVGSQLKSSQEAQPAPTLAPPGAISGLAIEAMPGASEVTLSWAAPSGGGAPRAYTVQFKPDDAAGWFTATTAVTKPRFMLVGLTPSRNHNVQVFATNAAGSGAPMGTAVTTAAPPAAPPDGPSIVDGLGRYGNVTPDSITVTWACLAARVQYTVQFRAHDSDEPWRIYRVAIDQPPVTVTGLRANTVYDFRVFATNAAGNGLPSGILRETSGLRIPRWSDIVTDTDRPAEIDVTRVQMLFFTVISACFVALKIALSGVIPEIPGSYVALMGISNGVYLTAKFVGR
jgi:hypothetical protein